MQELNDLIPPDVEVSDVTANQILNRALQDANGWFDPLTNAARAVDFYEAKMKDVAQVGTECISEAVRVGDMMLELTKAALVKLLPNEGDRVQFDVPQELLSELADEFGPIVEMVIFNVDGVHMDIMSLGEYSSIYGD